MNENVVVKKKNKGVIVLLIILIIIVLGLSAYVVYDKVIEKNNVSEKEENTTTNKEKKFLLKDENKNIIYDSGRSILCKEEYDGSGCLSIEAWVTLPYLNINSDYANQINEELKNIYEKEKSESEEEFYTTIDYSYSINDNILSLVIEKRPEAEAYFYNIYNIDVYNGKKIENEKLLERKNIKKEDFYNQISTIVSNVLLNNNYGYGYHVSDSEEYQKFKKEQYDKTVSKENITIDNDMFLDESNNLNIIVKTHLLAGADYSYWIYNYDYKITGGFGDIKNIYNLTE